VAIAAAVFGTPLGWLYVLVSRPMQLSRSLVASYITSLIVVLAFSVVAIGVVVRLGFPSRAPCLAWLASVPPRWGGIGARRCWRMNRQKEKGATPELSGGQSVATAWSCLA
jgi:hypothetical protein